METHWPGKITLVDVQYLDLILVNCQLSVKCDIALILGFSNSKAWNHAAAKSEIHVA